VVSGPNVILALKVAVIAVTCLLLASLAALARGNYRLHGRLNLAFFILTATALLTLEVLVRFASPGLFDYFDEGTRRMLRLHLCFSLPAAALLPVMLYTGLGRRPAVHLTLAAVFGVLWVGTFVTGVFYLPHTLPGGP
jgi:uncharacterized membrane protein YozB (DUF420 family)